MKISKTVVFIFLSFILGNYNYSLEDYNSASPSYGLDVWSPQYSDHITLHYFSSKGWGGWSNTFGQLSDFQEELRTDGYENILIIEVGHSNLNTYNNSFCGSSDLPLVMDEFPNLPIRNQFAPDGLHKQIVILDYDGSLLGTYPLNSGLSISAKNYISDIIAENYQESTIGDINGDGTINVQDIILVVNMILSNETSNDGDINLDGIINVLDVVQLINIILA